MHYAKDKKFWRHAAWKIGSEGMQPEGQDLENRKINSRKNLYCIWLLLVLQQIDTYVWLRKICFFIAFVVPYVSPTWRQSKAHCLDSYLIKKSCLYIFLKIVPWLRNLDTKPFSIHAEYPLNWPASSAPVGALGWQFYNSKSSIPNVSASPFRRSTTWLLLSALCDDTRNSFFIYHDNSKVSSLSKILPQFFSSWRGR